MRRVELGGRADVDEHGAGRDRVLYFVPLDRRSGAVEPAFGHVAELVHRVLGRSERRRVRQLEVGEGRGTQPGTHRGGDHIDALVDPVGTHTLSAEDDAGVLVVHQL